MNKTKNILKIIGNFFAPPVCVFCEKTLEINAGVNFCDECLAKVSLCTEKLCCQKCGKPIVSHGKKPRCYFCLNTKPLYFDRIVSAFEYKDLMQSSIQRFKGAALLDYVPAYVKFLKEAFLAEYADLVPDFVCCVPSHKDKFLTQGFDNVEQMTEDFSKEMKFRFEKDLLKKSRKTRKQTELGYRERRKNLVDSMVVPKPRVVEGKKVLLIDDVCTTRATVIEGSHALKKAGAKAVYVLTLATTAKEND